MLLWADRFGLTAEDPVEPNEAMSVTVLLAGAVPPTQLLPVDQVVPTFAHSKVAASTTNKEVAITVKTMIARRVRTWLSLAVFILLFIPW